MSRATYRLKWMLAFLAWFSALVVWGCGWLDNVAPHEMTGNYLLIMLILLLIVGAMQAKG